MTEILYLKGDGWQPLGGSKVTNLDYSSDVPDDALRTFVPRDFHFEATVTTWNDDAVNALFASPAPLLDFTDNDDGSTTLSLSARPWPHTRPSRFRAYGGMTIRADGDAWKAKPIYTIGRSAAGRARRIKQKRRRR